MQVCSTCNLSSEERIKTLVSTFRNFAPEKPISDSVVYFWESHTNNLDDKEKHQSTVDLIYKVFDIELCESYEVRTGYLNRYNFLSKPMNKSSPEEIEKAISEGIRSQEDWLRRCEIELPGFKLKKWQDCISKGINPFYEDCKELIVEKIQTDKEFSAAFLRTINEYSKKHGTDIENGKAYMIEELAWVLNLPLVHLNKQIYLIHVGVVGDAITQLFERFSSLQKAVKWLSPKFSSLDFSNDAAFLMHYRNNRYLGYSYAMENKILVKPVTIFQKRINKNDEKRVLFYR